MIFLHNNFHFCTPRLKIQQPVLPYWKVLKLNLCTSANAPETKIIPFFTNMTAELKIAYFSQNLHWFEYSSLIWDLSSMNGNPRRHEQVQYILIFSWSVFSLTSATRKYCKNKDQIGSVWQGSSLSSFKDSLSRFKNGVLTCYTINPLVYVVIA